MDHPALPPVDITPVRIHYIPQLGSQPQRVFKSSHLVLTVLGSSVFGA